jgi:hypothetical protein
MAREKTPELTKDQLLTALVGMKQDKAMDKLMDANLKWKLISMNGRAVPCSDAGTRTDRVLLDMEEEKVTGARIG